MAEKYDKETIHVKTKKPALRKMSRDTARGEQLWEKVYNAVVKTLLKRRSGEFTLDEIAIEIGATKGIIYISSRREICFISLTTIFYADVSTDQSGRMIKIFPNSLLKKDEKKALWSFLRSKP